MIAPLPAGPEFACPELVNEIESQTPQQRMAASRPLNKRERADFERRRKVVNSAVIIAVCGSTGFRARIEERMKVRGFRPRLS